MLILSIAFFFLLFPFSSSVAIFSKLLREVGLGDLGFYSVGVVYFTYSIACFAAPSVATLFKKPQTALQVAAFSYFIWILSGLCSTVEGASKELITFCSIFGSIL